MPWKRSSVFAPCYGGLSVAYSKVINIEKLPWKHNNSTFLLLRCIWIVELYVGCCAIYGLLRYIWIVALYMGCCSIYGLLNYIWVFALYMGCRVIYGLLLYTWVVALYMGCCQNYERT